MKHRHPAFLILSLMTLAFVVSAQNTTRRGLKPQQPALTDTTLCNRVDTIFSPASLIAIYSYEKPLTSNKESFHVSNNSERPLVEIIAQITYLDYQGNEIHKRTIPIKCDIPEGATRLLTFPSWDIQKRFYYAKGPKPRRQAFPFDVDIEIVAAIYSHM